MVKAKHIICVFLQVSPILPLDLITTVAEFLAGSDQFGTLAIFSSMCSVVRQSVIPVLCETVVLRGQLDIDWPKEDSMVRAFFERHGKHTKYVSSVA